MDVKTVISCVLNEIECPGHFKIVVQRADITFDQLQVKLYGGTSWIYQSLINVILGMITDEL